MSRWLEVFLILPPQTHFIFMKPHLYWFLLLNISLKARREIYLNLWNAARYHPTTTISIIKTCDILLSDKLQVCIPECWAICLLYVPLRRKYRAVAWVSGEWRWKMISVQLKYLKPFLWHLIHRHHIPWHGSLRFITDFNSSLQVAFNLLKGS